MTATYQRKANFVLGIVAVCLLVVLCYLFWSILLPVDSVPIESVATPTYAGPPRGQKEGNLAVMWDSLPERFVSTVSRTDSERTSNIHPKDYTGPDACRKCHEKNYASWSKHPHRWMNAMVDEAKVVGDFSGASINYQDGIARFYLREGKRHITYERSDLAREYQVTQTIGSRFF